jgi:antitoxin component of RelBE/YafQ-DinJ toxin-antitoxin module
MQRKVDFPAIAAGKIRTATKAQIAAATARYGVSESALVRMALEYYAPRFLKKGRL